MTGMLVSIFTDASLNDKQETAGWGCWARSERGKGYEGGTVQARLVNSNEAETVAVLKGLEFCLHVGIMHKGDIALVQLDNLHVCKSLPFTWDKGCRMLQQPLPNFSRTHLERSYLAAIEEFGLIHDIRIASRWIKGHTDGSTPRTWVNNLCDRLANQGRRATESWRAGNHRVSAFIHNREKVEIFGVSKPQEPKSYSIDLSGI